MGKRVWKVRSLSSSHVFIDPDTLYWCALKDLSEEETIPYPASVQTLLREHLLAASTRIGLELIELHLTESCNLRCSYCYASRYGYPQGNEISPTVLNAVAKRTVEYADQSGVMPLILFHGGEPLLCKNRLQQMIETFPAECRFAIQTNGTLLGSADVEFLIRHRVSIGISLDGVADWNDRTRMFPGGSGTFHIIDASLEALRGYEDVGVITTVTARNVNGLKELMQYLRQKEVTSVTLNPVSPETDTAEKLVASTTTLVSAYCDAVGACVDMNPLDAAHSLIIDNVEAILTNILSDYRPVFCHMSPCGAGRLNLVVTADGMIWPCSGFVGRREYRCGSVLECSFTSALNAQPCIRLRDRTVDEIEPCMDCAYKHICGANCPIPLLHLYGDWNRPSVYCQFMQYLVDFIFDLLISNLDAGMRLLSAQRRIQLARGTPLAVQWGS
jgi:uncharacterized protein